MMNSSTTIWVGVTFVLVGAINVWLIFQASARVKDTMTLAMVLTALLFVKVPVARYYKTHHSLLTRIGLVIFVLSFVLIGITAVPYRSHQAVCKHLARCNRSSSGDPRRNVGRGHDGEAMLQMPQSR
jgi:FlaA1/EpsC-like NDP-sugar epimerase